MSVRVQVVRALPRFCESVELVLDEGATVADAVLASGLAADERCGLAVFGDRVDAGRVLVDGERVELLRPLLIDPKDARRRRAAGAR